MPETVVICDDETTNVDQWVAGLQTLLKADGRFRVEGHTVFLEDVRELEARRAAARKGEAYHRKPTLFDSAAIVVVDYDLLLLGETSYVTGETVAYLARCYSECGVIVVLNQYGSARYDLTLRGHPESFADLNIGSKHLHNPMLWGLTTAGFAPWAWPVIPDMLDRHRKRVEDLLERGLDRTVANVLGLSDEAISGLSRSAREFIEIDQHQLAQITCRQVAAKDGPMLERKDDLADDRARASVASARISRWCEDWLLPEQDLLVDGPHLVLRYPSLLTGDFEAVTSWDAVAERRSDKTWKPMQSHMAPYAFSAQDWLSRPAWWGKRLGENAKLREVADPWNAVPVPFGFCEDVSRFAPPEATRGFVADLESPYVRRSIADHDHPFFAAIKAELEEVDYQPLVRLSR